MRLQVRLRKGLSKAKTTRPAIKTRAPMGRQNSAVSIKIKPVALLGPHGPHGPENSTPTTDRTPTPVTFKPTRNGLFTGPSYYERLLFQI